MTGVKICAILEIPTQYGELENITLLFLESSNIHPLSDITADSRIRAMFC